MKKLLVDGVSTKIHRVPPGALLACLSFPDLSASLEQGRPHSIDLSTRTLRYPAGQLASRRREIGTRWRRLTAGRQALLALAHPRCGDTCAQLAAGFGIGLATVHRYVREAIDVLAVLAPTLDEAMATARTKAYVILDGTVPPIDRIAADRPHCSGKKRHHGMNVQVLTDPFGRLLWASPALPGATHDLTAAREHGLIYVDAAAYGITWARARERALTRTERTSGLAKRPYDLRHAGISFWLCSGVDPAECARRAGQSIEVLFRHYAKFLDGLREQANRLIEQSMNEWQRVSQGEALEGWRGDLVRDWSGSTGQEGAVG